MAVLGQEFKNENSYFTKARKNLKKHIVQFGFTSTFEEYARWLWEADILPVTSKQDFFGGSVVEAIYCSCYPILPKRLAYPEHLPNNTTCFYNTFNELCQKLETAISKFKNLEKQNTFVKKYDWKEIIGEYDKKLKQIKKP